MTQDSQAQSLNSLHRLVDLRGREVERLSAAMAEKRVLRERYLSNITRMEQLASSTGASGSLPPALSVNCAQYKQTMLEKASAHRQDLELHEADMAVAQRALLAAEQRRSVLDQVLAQRREEFDRASQTRLRRQEDDLALQVWHRRQA